MKQSLMRPVYPIIAELRDLRIGRSLSQVELSEIIGVSHTWLGKIETGVIPNPTIRMVDCVALALGRRLMLTSTVPSPVGAPHAE